MADVLEFIQEINPWAYYVAVTIVVIVATYSYIKNKLSSGQNWTVAEITAFVGILVSVLGVVTLGEPISKYEGYQTESTRVPVTGDFTLNYVNETTLEIIRTVTWDDYYGYAVAIDKHGSGVDEAHSIKDEGGDLLYYNESGYEFGIGLMLTGYNDTEHPTYYTLCGFDKYWEYSTKTNFRDIGLVSIEVIAINFSVAYWYAEPGYEFLPGWGSVTSHQYGLAMFTYSNGTIEPVEFTSYSTSANFETYNYGHYDVWEFIPNIVLP